MAKANSLMGVSELKYKELSHIPVPKRTQTYTPLAHKDLVDFTEELSGKLLGNDWEKDGEKFGIAREGKQLFGYHSYKKLNSNEDTSLTIGFRNSYDKSMSAGFVMGERVLVCSNLMFVGEIKRMRKHTGEAGRAIRHLLYDLIDEGLEKRIDIRGEIELMKTQPLDNDKAWQLMGLLYGKDILTPRNLPVVKREWLKPSQDHGVESLWRLYQACTFALKEASPQTIMQRHTNLHDLMNRISKKIDMPKA